MTEGKIINKNCPKCNSGLFILSAFSAICPFCGIKLIAESVENNEVKEKNMNEKQIYKLTATHIKTFDEIRVDKDTNSNTLGVALNYHSNVLSTLLKKERKLWHELLEIYDLDRGKRWKMKSVEGSMQIIEDTEK